MDDKELITLFFNRDESAVSLTRARYSALCERIAFNILENREDCEEAVNDTMLRAWSTIPPQRPISLAAYLTSIVRSVSLDIYRKRTSQKRTGDRMSQTLDEISELLPDSRDADSELDRRALTERIDRFLLSQPKGKRMLFVRRYYYLDSVKELSERYGLSESNVTVTLTRMRKKLKELLLREGYL